MEKPAELCPVIAVRRFILLPDQEVIVRLGLPFTSDGFPGESRCPIQIEGLGSGKIRHVVGIDAFQSLWLALLHIGTLLYTSEEYKSGRLFAFEGDPDLCLPVHDDFRDLLPPLPERPPGHIPPAI